MKRILCLLSAVCGLVAQAEQPAFAYEGVYQWSVASTPPDRDRSAGRAYLWIPEQCSRLRGVVVGQQNMLEEPIFAVPAFRAELAKADLAIVFIAPIQCGIWHFTADESAWLRDILDRLAEESGYAELRTAPVAFIGHSAMAMWPYFGASTWGERAICGISLKGAWADTAKDWGSESVGKGLAGVPFLLLDGEYEDAHGRGARSRAFCERYPEVPFSFCAEDGAGHFDWSDELAAYLGLYLRKAAQLRFPVAGGPAHPVRKRTQDGRECGVRLPLWKRYELNTTEPGYWFFDAEMAAATERMQERFRQQTQTPLVGYRQRGELVPQRKTHLQIHLKFDPTDGADGVRFTFEPAFAEQVEEGRLADWTGLPAGARAPHPPDERSLYVQKICGPAIRVGKNEYEIRLDRGSIGRDKRDIDFQAIFPGDATYQRAVQQAVMSLPKPKGKGNGKTYHFVREGAATIDDAGRLTWLPLPPRTRQPHLVTVCDYTWSERPPTWRTVEWGAQP
ncbi:MAG: hypothetical protein ACI4RD_05440 [Kiritimatiellia bacterium]